MTTLLVGFDSAWTAANSGALVGALHSDDNAFHDLGGPQIADFSKAATVIQEWQAENRPSATLILLDQPTIVKNGVGQRRVESIVASPVSLRYSGMQPANTARAEMFGKDAPVWPFLTRFGGPADPLEPVAGTRVLETYPVLVIVALGWTLPDSRNAGRLPKYNPDRRKTFSNSDWNHVCRKVSAAFRERRLMDVAGWVEDAARNISPRKRHQDCLDACICLLVALYLAEKKECLMVGDCQTGYIVVPHCSELHGELEARCKRTGLVPSEWVRAFKMEARRIRS